jgi:hypothetical protein
LTIDDPDDSGSSNVSADRAAGTVSRRALLAGGAVVGVAAVGGLAFAATRSSSPLDASDVDGSAATTEPAVDWRSGLPVSLVGVVEAWAQAPGTHERMGDWRRVGYRRGAEDPQAPDTVVTAESRGVLPGQPDDVSARLQAILDEIGESGGGVLRLGEGRYVLDNPLFISHPNVVLQGAGKALTTLYFSRPLAESIGPSANWSWSGGQVCITPKDLLAGDGASGDGGGFGGGGGGGGGGFRPGDPIATLSPTARGADVVTVDDSSGIVPGTMIMLEIQDGADHPLVRGIGGDVAGAATYDWSTVRQLDHASWHWPVACEVVSPTEVRLEQPLRVAITPDTPAQLRALGPAVHDSGVEGLTIENKLIPQTPHNQNPGSNGVAFEGAYDCWATDIHVLNADVAFGMTGAKSCTLTGISAGGRALHHFTICRAGSHDNLMQDFHLEDFTVPLAEGAYTHGISVENLGSGNVWRRGQMDIGTFDSHRAMPFENLRTDITLVNKVGVPGGAFGAGPCFGTRFVHWGITVTTDNNLCMGITDVAPKALTAAIAGLTEDGSMLRQIPAVQSAAFFDGDLEGESLEFGTDLAEGRDLLDIQRLALPLS